MELSKWKRRRFTPQWGDNHLEDEPCIVDFAAPTVGRMARWREVVASVPKNPNDEGAVKLLDDWAKGVERFRADLFSDLILGIENLTMEGRSVSREDAISFITDNEGLREEVFLAIISEGSVSKSEGKD